MRILLSSVPAVAHVLALRPLAAALTARGHAVASVCAESARFLLPDDVELLEAGPDLPELLSDDRVDQEPRPDGLPWGVGRFFGVVRTELTIGAARTVAEAWRPDVVVSEGLDGVGIVLAAERRLPHITVSLGPVCQADVDAELRATLVEAGLPVAPTRRLDPWPVALRPPGWVAPGDLTPVRASLALPDDGDEPVEPGPVALPPGDGPAVLLTLGSLFATVESLTPAITALTGAGIRVVVALPPGLELEPTDGVVTRAFGPLGPALDAVDALVCHAGAATVLAGVIRARPVVAVPLGADHFINAAGVEASGIGLRAAPAQLADATLTVLGDGCFAERVIAMSATVAATPTWDDLLDDGLLCSGTRPGRH